LVNDRSTIGSKYLERVVAVCRPITIAVPTKVEHDCLPPLRRQVLGRPSPSVPGLTSPMQEQDRPSVRLSARVSSKANARRSAEDDVPDLHDTMIPRAPVGASRAAGISFAECAGIDTHGPHLTGRETCRTKGRKVTLVVESLTFDVQRKESQWTSS
jgi:hypothetical protein